VRRSALLAVLVAAAAVPLLAQPPLQDGQGSPQPPVFRSQANLVSLNVSVVDAAARYVTGLQPADFAVYEDGVKQDVRFFESNAVPIDLILLVDTSASMTDKMDAVHQAALGFLHTLRNGDRGAVVAFSDTVSILQPLTGDRASLEKAVESTHAHGATALNNAIYIALKQFGSLARKDGEVRRQAIAVVSDGDDTASLVTFDDVLALARKTGVNIYTIGLHSKTDVQRIAQERHRYFNEAEYAMRTLARETGAQAFFPLDLSELKGVYAAISSELATQYSIGYVPANGRQDGRFRRIIVQIVSRPELRLRTRLGYIAEPERATVTSTGSLPQ
jgi:Ca-activated chloride channel homolog